MKFDKTKLIEELTKLNIPIIDDHISTLDLARIFGTRHDTILKNTRTRTLQDFFIVDKYLNKNGAKYKYYKLTFEGFISTFIYSSLFKDKIDFYSIVKCEYCGKESSRLYFKDNIFICNKHYNQIRQNGEILRRTKFDKNEIVIYEDYAEIIMYDIKNKESGRSKIDIEDINKIKDYKWTLLKNGYAHSCKMNIRLHRFLINADSNMEVDHINIDRLDNRKINLRQCTHAENCKNQPISKNNTSGVTGVSWSKKDKVWVAYIRLNYKNIRLGVFKDKMLAVKARKEGEIKYFGEFANQQTYDQYIQNNL